MSDDNSNVPLSPAQRARIRRLSRPKDPEIGEEAGELNIVPYLDIVMNIIVFVISSLSVVFLSSIETTPPAIGGGTSTKAAPKTDALNLHVLITGEGLSLKTSQGNVATGCNSFGGGVTVPKSSGRHDYAELTRCARELKKRNERAANETQVNLTANPDVDYQTVVEVMDALRADQEGPLFPDVGFGVAR